MQTLRFVAPCQHFPYLFHARCVGEDSDKKMRGGDWSATSNLVSPTHRKSGAYRKEKSHHARGACEAPQPRRRREWCFHFGERRAYYQHEHHNKIEACEPLQTRRSRLCFNLDPRKKRGRLQSIVTTLLSRHRSCGAHECVRVRRPQHCDDVMCLGRVSRGLVQHVFRGIWLISAIF